VPSGSFWEVSNGNCLSKASIKCRPWHAMDASGSLVHGTCFGEGSMICVAQLLLNLRWLCWIRTLLPVVCLCQGPCFDLWCSAQNYYFLVFMAMQYMHHHYLTLLTCACNHQFPIGKHQLATLLDGQQSPIFGCTLEALTKWSRDGPTELCTMSANSMWSTFVSWVSPSWNDLNWW
jgi:hypothetical protein